MSICNQMAAESYKARKITLLAATLSLLVASCSEKTEEAAAVDASAADAMIPVEDAMAADAAADAMATEVEAAADAAADAGDAAGEAQARPDPGKSGPND